jgi:hypothetical protein
MCPACLVSTGVMIGSAVGGGGVSVALIGKIWWKVRENVKRRFSFLQTN